MIRASQLSEKTSLKSRRRRKRRFRERLEPHDNSQPFVIATPSQYAPRSSSMVTIRRNTLVMLSIHDVEEKF